MLDIEKCSDREIEQYFDDLCASAPDSSQFMAGQIVTDPELNAFSYRFSEDYNIASQYLGLQGKRMMHDDHGKHYIVSLDGAEKMEEIEYAKRYSSLRDACQDF